MRNSVLLWKVGFFFLVLGAVEAYALNCSIEVNNTPGSDGASLSSASILSVPTSARLYGRVRECRPNGKTICVRASQDFNFSPSVPCEVSLYACPAIVRKYRVACRKGPVLVNTTDILPGRQRVTFRGVVNPIRLDRRKRKAQVSFQAVSTCGNAGGNISVIKSTVVGVNVTCQNGVTMDTFMKQLPGRLK